MSILPRINEINRLRQCCKNEKATAVSSNRLILLQYRSCEISASIKVVCEPLCISIGYRHGFSHWYDLATSFASATNAPPHCRFPPQTLAAHIPCIRAFNHSRCCFSPVCAFLNVSSAHAIRMTCETCMFDASAISSSFCFIEFVHRNPMISFCMIFIRSS